MSDGRTTSFQTQMSRDTHGHTEVVVVPDYAYLFLVRQVLPRAKHPLESGSDQPCKLMTPVRSGYVYVRYEGDDGRVVWEEYLVLENPDSPGVENKRAVALNEDETRDMRFSTGEDALTLFKVPGDRPTQIAYAEVQWSARRIQWMKSDEKARAQRMQTFDLTSFQCGPPEGLPRIFRIDDALDQLVEMNESARGILHGDAAEIEASNESNDTTDVVRCFRVDDELAIARQYAENLDIMWEAMEKCIADVKKDKWYRCAHLVNQVFSMSAGIPDGRRSEFDRLFDALDVEAVEDVLRSDDRATIRGHIQDRRGAFADYLAGDGPEGQASPRALGAALGDYAALPAEPWIDIAPCYADLWTTLALLLARLADLPYELDLELETAIDTLPPQRNTTQEKLLDEFPADNDRCRELLRDLGDLEIGHPLHWLIFAPYLRPEDASRSGTAPGEPDLDDSARFALTMQVVRRGFLGLNVVAAAITKAVNPKETERGRRSWTSTVKLYSTMKLTAEKTFRIVDFIDWTLGGPKYDLITKIIKTVKLDKGVIGAVKAKPMLVDLGEGRTGYLRAYMKNREGEWVCCGYMNREELRNGRQYNSMRKAKNLDHLRKSKWWSTEIDVQVIERSPSDFKTGFGAGVLLGVGLLEAWNIWSTLDALYKKAAEGALEPRQILDVTGALLDGSAFTFEVVESGLLSLPAPASSTDRLGHALRDKVTRLPWMGRLLGVVGGAVGLVTTTMDLDTNVAEGDDAALADAVLLAGTTIAVIGALTSAAFAGPALIAGAVVLFVGTVLKGILEDRPIERWVKNGPFSKAPLSSAYSKKINEPDPAVEELLQAGAPMTIEIDAVLAADYNMDEMGDSPEDYSPWLIRAHLNVPYRIENVSVLEWDWSFWKQEGDKQIKLEMPEWSLLDDLGTYTILMAIPRELPYPECGNDEYFFKMTARLDVFGDKRNYLPPQGPNGEVRHAKLTVGIYGRNYYEWVYYDD